LRRRRRRLLGFRFAGPLGDFRRRLPRHRLLRRGRWRWRRCRRLRLLLLQKERGARRFDLGRGLLGRLLRDSWRRGRGRFAGRRGRHPRVRRRGVRDARGRGPRGRRSFPFLRHRTGQKARHRLVQEHLFVADQEGRLFVQHLGAKTAGGGRPEDLHGSGARRQISLAEV
jgi:hypothetical protein